GKVDRLGGDEGEGEWVDEVVEDGVMLDVEGSLDGEEKVGNVEDGSMAVKKGEKLGNGVDDGIL
ncbi:MAG: hypothetical protein L6R42_011428, partial [Xanthoria sp. 1 TBL-2021]